MNCNQNIFLLQSLVAQKATQFNGFAQHDAQEFMAFFLDGLHEVCCPEYTIHLPFPDSLAIVSLHYIEVNVKKKNK